LNTPWDEARARAEAAERKPGLTPYRRGLSDIFLPPLTGAIAVELADKTRLPNGRLGVLLQAFTPRELALMAVEAVLPQIGRPRRRRDDSSFERALKEAIGEIFYANLRLRAAHRSKSKNYIRRTKWRQKVLQGSLKAKRGETLASRQERLRKTRFATWQSLLSGVSRPDIVRVGAWLLARVVEADIVILVGKELVPNAKYRAEIIRLNSLIIRRNVHLTPPEAQQPAWTAPKMGGRRLLTHWNQVHQANVAKSFTRSNTTSITA
jgi:hypothetical protein